LAVDDVTRLERSGAPYEPGLDSTRGPGRVLAAISAWTRGHLLIAGLVLLGLLLAIGVLTRMKSGGATKETVTPPAHVTVLVPHRAAAATTASFTGTINARYDQPIGVEAGEGGRIAAVYVEAGDKVKMGQVLARLDTAVVAPQVASLEASLDQAKADAALASADYRRADAVGPAGALSKEETERRYAVSITAAAKVKVAEALLAEARGRLARTEVRASGDGIILTRHAEVGQTATVGGEPLFRLAKGGEIELRGNVAEQDLPRLKAGQDAVVTVTGVATPFPGKVWLVGAVIDPITRLGSVRVALTPHPDLRPGAFAQATVNVGREDRIVVPQTAVLSDGPANFVFLVDAKNQVERRAVTVQGTAAEGIIIASGLEGTERVVTMAGAFLRDGEEVQPTEATANTDKAP
jgi:RND family efflux transporter MFP subunit